MPKRGMRMVESLVVDPYMLLGTNIPENDHVPWSAIPTYEVGTRVIRASKIWEATGEVGNVNKDPLLDENVGFWKQVSVTNRWKAFDLSSTTKTIFDEHAYFDFMPSRTISSLILLGLEGVTQVRVVQTDPEFGVTYDKTYPISVPLSSSDWWTWTFEERTTREELTIHDIPAYPMAQIRVELWGATGAGVGTLSMGQQQEFGYGLLLGASLGIQDFSRQDENEYGDLYLKKRAFVKRSNYRIFVHRDDLERVYKLLSSVRATPCLWSPSDRSPALDVWGICRNFDIVIPHNNYFECSMELRSMT